MPAYIAEIWSLNRSIDESTLAYASEQLMIDYLVFVKKSHEL